MIKIGILTCSDKGSKGERIDTSGVAIKEIVKEIGGEVIKYEIVPDAQKIISEKLKNWSDEMKLDLIFTTGGTGLSERDITPEATEEVIDRKVPGFSEIMRLASFKNTKHSILSRGVSGLRKKTLIINLPGSEKAVRENLKIILPSIPHAIEIIHGKTEHK
ncbi:MAG: MogA/MoaB family molybdenum cofactor biosynthesis protein [Elusimicrobiota bacterium]|nr:MogA/MoaB family molybdenum cofactor biosynthesis protein [Elusimicrobiota bacterium]